MLNTTQQQNILNTVMMTILYLSSHGIYKYPNTWKQVFLTVKYQFTSNKSKGNGLSLPCNPAIKMHFTTY